MQQTTYLLITMSGSIETIQTYEPSILKAFSIIVTHEPDDAERTGWYSIVDSYEARCERSSEEDQQILMKSLHEALQSTYAGTCNTRQSRHPIQEYTLARFDENMTDADIRHKIHEIQHWYSFTIGDDWEECKAGFEDCLSRANPDYNFRHVLSHMASLHRDKGRNEKGKFWQGWEEYLRDKEAKRASSWESWKQINEHQSYAGCGDRSFEAFEREMTVAHDEDKIHVVHLWHEKTIGYDWDDSRAGFMNMLAGVFSSDERGRLSDVAHLFYGLHLLNPNQKDEGSFWEGCQEYFRQKQAPDPASPEGSNRESEGSDGEA